MLKTKFIADASKILDDNYSEINWYNIADMYDLQEEIIIEDEWGSRTRDSEVILQKTINKDENLVIKIIMFISNKYDLPELENLIREYNLLSQDNLLEKKLNKYSENHDLRMFISYSTKDIDEALKIQKYFEKGGITVFLSENKLKPSDEYKNKIFDEINKADIFFYVLSENSNSSDWCNQEMGMTFLKYKLDLSKIFILRVDETLPTGFLNGFQAESIKKEGYLKRIAEEIDNYYRCNIIATIHEKDLNMKIDELYSVTSYDKAGTLLMEISNESLFLNEHQLKKICDASITNNQIYNAWKCKKPLNKILEVNKEFIDEEIHQAVLKKIK